MDNDEKRMLNRIASALDKIAGSLANIEKITKTANENLVKLAEGKPKLDPMREPFQPGQKFVVTDPDHVFYKWQGQIQKLTTDGIKARIGGSPYGRPLLPTQIEVFVSEVEEDQLELSLQKHNNISDCNAAGCAGCVE